MKLKEHKLMPEKQYLNKKYKACCYNKETEDSKFSFYDAVTLQGSTCRLKKMR